MISDQSVRDRIIHEHGTLFAVDAGAGTGKTTLLVSRLIALLLEKQAPLSRIAAITFTEKAAAELAERLRSKLEKELESNQNPTRRHEDTKETQESWNKKRSLIEKALSDMELAPISTIHSFCAGLLREYPVEAGVDPQFTLLDEVQSGAFEAQAWEHWLKKNLSQPVEPLFHFLRLGGTFEQVDELKAFLKRNRTLLAVPSPKPLPSVEAFHKKWKTFVEWTKKEAVSCANHEDSLYKPLEAFWALCGSIDLTDPSDLAFELALLKVPKVGNKGTQANWGKERLTALRDGFVKLAEDHQAAFGSLKDAVVQNLVHWVAGYLAEWDSQKAQGGFLDFDDLLLKTRDLLRDHPEAREEMKERLDYLFVDEFQDTDPLQVEIVFFLSEHSKKNEKYAQKATLTRRANAPPPSPIEGEGRKENPSGLYPSPLVGEGGVRGDVDLSGVHERDWRKVKLEQGKLFLVGDPKQSIYRFRRADVAIYEETKKRILENGGKVEVLTENFRTVGGLVDWVNGRFPSQFEGTGIAYQPLSANRKEGKTEGTLPILWGLKVPVAKDAPNTKAAFRQLEAEWAATFLKDQVLGGGFTVSDPKTHELRPVRKGDIAILFRDLSNDNEEFWEEALRKRDLSYQIVGGKRFYNRPEIVALSTLLTCLSSPADEALCVAVLRGPLFGFSDEELFLHRARAGKFHFQEPARGKVGEAFKLLRDWFQATRALGVSDTLLELYEATDLLAVTAGQPHGEQRVANLMKVLDQARQLETSQHFTYRAFTKWLTTQQEEGTLEGEAPGPDSSEDRITLMTIHKAKGLEFPVVFLSGWAADPKDSGSLMDRKHSAGAFKVGKADLGLKTLNYDGVKQEEDLQRKAEDTRLLYVAATRARDCLLLPHFEMPAEGKFQNEDLFAGPLLKALEEKGTDVRWAVARDGGEPLNDPPAWVVPLDEKPSAALDAEKEKLKLAQETREKELKALRGEREFKSVTSVLAVDQAKKEREEKVFEEPEAPSPWGGKELGTFAHLLLEKGWDRDGVQLRKAAESCSEKMSVPKEQVDQVLGWVEKALKSGPIQRAKTSTQVFRELPISGKQADGSFLNAVLDLAYLEGDQWVILDYKTDQDTQKLAGKYREQLGHYAKLLEASSGKKVKEAHLLFVRHGKAEQVPL